MKKSHLLGAVWACLSLISFNASAAIVTQGDLTSDDTTNIITDSLNNVEYLRLDVLADLTYAQTVSVLGTQDGGGWSIASSTDAVNFTQALFGGTPACTHDGTAVANSDCGTLAGWFDTKLGANYDGGDDIAWFLDASGEADYITIRSDGFVYLQDYTLSSSDAFAAGGAYADRTIAWLLVRPSEVPIPTAIWLFGSGLLGLIGVARRKVRI